MNKNKSNKTFTDKSNKYTIQSVHIEHHGDSKEICGTSGRMYLNILFREAVTSFHHFTAFCYNSLLNLVDESEGRPGDTESGENVLKLTFHPKRMWTEGHYFVLLLHNDEPLYKVSFSLGEKGMIDCSYEPVHKNSVDYMLARYLGKNPLWYNELHNLPGMTAARRQLLDLYKQSEFDRLRKRRKLNVLRHYSNFVITGAGGRNKEIFAKNAAFLLIGSEIYFKQVNAYTLTETHNAVDPYETATELFTQCYGRVIYLDHLLALTSPGASNVIGKMINALQKQEGMFILSGMDAEINQLFELVPELAAYFPEENHFKTESFSMHDILNLIEQQLESESFYLSSDAQQVLYRSMKTESDNGTLLYWKEDIVSKFIHKAIYPRMQERILLEDNQPSEDLPEALIRIEAQDIDTTFFEAQANLFDESMKQLNALVGLSKVKQNMEQAFKFVRFNEKRKQLRLPVQGPGAHHMIFTGNPGTGKTTVAKMVGKIYHALGQLSKGEVIVTGRSQLVGRFIGETEKNMQEILERARGNVLFIDEAYTLYDGASDHKDFGFRVLESLLAVLALEHADILVIFAGYEKEMKAMMDANLGLWGRFPHQFHFEDYSVDELLQIGYDLLDKKGYVLTNGARSVLKETVVHVCEHKDSYFSNARWMGQLITNGVLPAMAERVFRSTPSEDKRLYQTIEEEDVRFAVNRMKINEMRLSPRSVIGFRA